MNILIKIGLIPILLIIFMMGFIAYVVGDKKYSATLHAQAKVIAKEGIQNKTNKEKNHKIS